MNPAGTEQVKQATPQPILFKSGLPGLGESKRFTLQTLENNPLFFFLQSEDDEGIGLILLDPFLSFPGYSVELNDLDKKDLEVEKDDDVLVFTTVTVISTDKMITNLAAPLVINIKKQIARQIFLPERSAEMRTPLPTGKK
ncbi:MAG: flagellar assembly protein FliW [Bacillota bacterium]|nr:flagellar assembly protein FliW [Bacillota bacterium]